MDSEKSVVPISRNGTRKTEMLTENEQNEIIEQDSLSEVCSAVFESVETVNSEYMSSLDKCANLLLSQLEMVVGQSEKKSEFRSVKHDTEAVHNAVMLANSINSLLKTKTEAVKVSASVATESIKVARGL